MGKSNVKPPGLANRFLKSFCREEILEEVQGDLTEAFYDRLYHQGKFRATCKFWLDVILFFKPYSFSRYSRSIQYIPMYKNYFKIALRNILKRKSFTAVNLTGLTLSLVVVLFVGLFLHHHLTYDSFYPHSDTTYRIGNKYRSQIYAPYRFVDFWRTDASKQMRMYDYLSEFEGVENVVYSLQSDAAISRQEKYFVELEEKKVEISHLLMTSTPDDYIEVFPPELMTGSFANFTQKENQVLLTESVAEKFYGIDWKDIDLVGKTFRMPAEDLENDLYSVAGVIKDAPDNSHFTYNIIAHTPRIPSWATYTYIRTSNPLNVSEFSDKMLTGIDAVIPGYSENELYRGPAIQNIEDIHMSEMTLLYELRPKIEKSVLQIFGAVAIIILLVAWTNYMNLTIATYAPRQREIGMRKVLGARSRDVIFQLLTEVTFVALLAMPLAMLIVSTALPYFNQLMGITISWHMVVSWPVLGIAFLLMLLTGILSGLYPAIVFSSRGMLKLFKGSLSKNDGRFGFGVRRILIGFQFVLLVTMISVTAFAYQQKQLVQRRSLGFNKDRVVTIPTESLENHQSLKRTLKEKQQIEFVGSGRLPGRNRFNQTTYKLDGEEEIFEDLNIISIDYEAMLALGIDHPAFEKFEQGWDSVYLVNEQLVRKFNRIYGTDRRSIIGSIVRAEPEYVDEETGVVGVPYFISGVLEDIHYFSLKYEINPLIFQVRKERDRAFSSVVKIKKGADLAQAMGIIEDAYYSAGNERPFDYSFLSSDMQDLYRSDKRALLLVSMLSIVSIVLSVMGLIGLVSFMVISRRKEIGIRKVFGADVSDILLLINKEFIVLMLIATAISVPIIYILAGGWLESFAYRIEMEPWVIGLAGAASLVIVAIVVSLQSRQAAQQNPSTTLTDE